MAEQRFLYHCIIQSPVEPLTTYELALTGPDQSRGQAALTEAVQHAFQDFSGQDFDPEDHLCYVAFTVHPDGSPAWEQDAADVAAHGPRIKLEIEHDNSGDPFQLDLWFDGTAQGWYNQMLKFFHKLYVRGA